jgi:hypothetical protein
VAACRERGDILAQLQAVQAHSALAPAPHAIGKSIAASAPRPRNRVRRPNASSAHNRPRVE